MYIWELLIDVSVIEKTKLFNWEFVVIYYIVSRPNLLLYFFSMREFLDKFFELCREYQEEVPPHKMAEILRDYADRLEG